MLETNVPPVEIISIIYSICNILGGALGASTLIAIFSLILFGVVSFGFRFTVQRVLFQRWKSTQNRHYYLSQYFPNLKAPDWLKKSADEMGVPIEEMLLTVNASLERDLFSLWGIRIWPGAGQFPFENNELSMRKVQLDAQDALENISKSYDRYGFLFDYASPEEVSTLIICFSLQRHSPDEFRRIMSSGESSDGYPDSAGINLPAIALGSAQDAVSRSMNRRLDELQLRIATWWNFVSSSILIIIALSISVLASVLEFGASYKRPETLLAVLILGVLGGTAANWLTFMAKSIARGRLGF